MSELRVPPQNLDAERSVLGCQLLNSDSIGPVAEVIGISDFFSDVHQTIQVAITTLHFLGSAVDAITVASQLETTRDLSDIGGPAYLAEVMATVPHSGNAVHYAGIVAECSRRRKAIEIGKQLIEKAFDMSASQTALLESTIKAGVELTGILNETSKNKPKTLESQIGTVIDTFAAGSVETIYCGIPEIDAAIGGVAPGELVIIGARPSHGKTMFGVQWMNNAAGCGLPGLILSEEMSATSLAARALQSITAIPKDNWGTSSDQLRFELREHFKGRAELQIADKCHNIGAIERVVARAVQTDGIRIICVDYAQLIKGDGGSKYEQVSDVSMRMKQLATKHNLIVLLLAQLSRKMEERPDSTPMLSDLRDSGQLEQDADVVLMPFWPFKFDESYADKNEYRIYHRKNRNRGNAQAMIELRITPERQQLCSDERDPSDRFD